MDMQELGYFLYMERAELEEKVFDIAFGSMEYFGEEEELKAQIQEATTEELKNYIKNNVE